MDDVDLIIPECIDVQINPSGLCVCLITGRLEGIGKSFSQVAVLAPGTGSAPFLITNTSFLVLG